MTYKYLKTFILIFLITKIASAQVGIKYDNHETTDYTSGMKSGEFTHLVWDRNDDGGGLYVGNNKPKFFYWDNDDNKFGYLLDTRSMRQLNATFHSLELLNDLTLSNQMDQIRFEVPGENKYYLMSKTKTTNNALALFSPDDGGYIFQVKEQTGDFIINNGQLGIGTSSPEYDLDVNGNIRFKYGNSILAGSATYKKLIKTGWDGFGQDYVSFHVPGNTGNGGAKIYLKSDGSVGIGNTNPSEKLVVDGKILAEEVKVQNVPSSDYVFEPNYKLRPIEDVEAFIKQNKHLPDIPSAEEFKEDGVGLGEMDDMLLRKVEELTLYVIELKKENEAQNKQIKMLEIENQRLRNE